MRVLELPRVEAARLVVDMGAELWQTYCIMRLLADENDIVSVQQSELAALMNASRTTVWRRLTKLTEYRIQGAPIVRVEQYGGAGYWCTFRVMWDVKGAFAVEGVSVSTALQSCNSPSYRETTVSLDSLVAVASARPEPEESDGVLRNPKDVLTFWDQRYTAKYGTPYKLLNVGKEVGWAKRLLTKYGSERAKVIITAIIKNYDLLWMTPKFPRPTLGQAVSWLGKQAEAYAGEQEKAPSTEANLDELIEKGLI